MAPHLNISAFGKLEISSVGKEKETETAKKETAGEEIGKKTTTIETPLPIKARALLCYLLITKEEYTRTRLWGLFWGEDSDTKAQNSLRVALSSIKKLNEECIVTVGRQTLSFNAEVVRYFDLFEFDRIVESLSNGEDDDETIEAITRALELYRGDLLEGMSVKDAPEFQTWLEMERDQRRQKAMSLFGRQSKYFLATRRFDAARKSLQTQLQLEPWNEESHRQMMITLCRLGDINGALRQYELCRQRLNDELDVEPMPETVQLRERILAARSERPHNLPAETMEFIGRPSEINVLHQHLASPEHRLVTVLGLGGIGKTSLALHVARQLYHEQAITFLNGVFFISLVSVYTLEQLYAKTAETLEITLDRSQDSLTQIAEALSNRELLLVLDDWESLLYALQKFGSSSPSEGAELIRTLLTSCPNLKILVTSREPLLLRSEKRLELDGLAVPPNDAASIDGYSAAEFFLQVAKRVAPGFDVTDENRPHIIQICRMLDGMPLGLELAAAWVRVMSCKQIVAEIDNPDFLSAEMQDVPERQRSLRAVFDYSWQTISGKEREVFMRLSVFANGFTEDAARAIADLTPQVLISLFDRSLIKRVNSTATADSSGPIDHLATNQTSISHHRPELNGHSHGDSQPNGSARDINGLNGATGFNATILSPSIELPPRYSLHSVVRQYASEKLAEHKEIQYETRRKHSGYYANFVEKELARFYTDEHSMALALMEQEKQDTLSAWSWSLHYMQFENLEKILLSNQEYNILVGSYKEAELSARLSAEYLSTIVEKSEIPDQKVKIILGKILVYQARFLFEIAEFSSVISTAKEILALAKETQNVELQANALLLSGSANRYLGKSDQAHRELEESLLLAHQESLPVITATGKHELGVMYHFWADYEKAQKFYAEELKIWRSLGNRGEEMRALNNLGVLVHQSGDYLQARRYYSDALELFSQIGSRGMYSHMLNNLGRVYTEQRDFTKAKRYIEEAIHIKRALGDKLRESNALLSLGRNYMFLGKFELALKLHDDALEIKRTIGDWRGEAEALTYLALIRCLKGDRIAAIECTTVANAILERNTARFIQAQMMTIRSHIFCHAEEWDRAKEAATMALAEWQARKNSNLCMEPLADLARIEYALGNEQEAMVHVNTILEHLETGNLDGVNFPLHIYLICYDILCQMEDPRGDELLLRASEKLQRWSSAIEDDELRQAYLSINHHCRVIELSAL